MVSQITAPNLDSVFRRNPLTNTITLGIGLMVVWFARSALLVGLAAIALSACGNAAGVRVSNIDISQNYKPRQLGLVSGGDRELRVQVLNNPYSEVEQALFDAQVVNFMQGRALGYPVNFSLNPEVEYKPERRIRVLMVFDPPKSLSTIGICRREDLAAKAATPAEGVDPGRLRVLGAYCRGDLTVTRATATVPRGALLASTNLDGLMSQITSTLFPIRNDNLTDRDCSPFVIVC